MVAIYITGNIKFGKIKMDESVVLNMHVDVSEYQQCAFINSMQLHHNFLIIQTNLVKSSYATQYKLYFQWPIIVH